MKEQQAMVQAVSAKEAFFQNLGANMEVMESLAKARESLKKMKSICGGCDCLMGACDLSDGILGGASVSCRLADGKFIMPKIRCANFTENKPVVLVAIAV